MARTAFQRAKVTAGFLLDRIRHQANPVRQQRFGPGRSPPQAKQRLVYPVNLHTVDILDLTVAIGAEADLRTVAGGPARRSPNARRVKGKSTRAARFNSSCTSPTSPGKFLLRVPTDPASLVRDFISNSLETQLPEV